VTGHAFTLAGAALVARPEGALWWPGARLLALGDLHLGRSLRLARRGGTLLPPYETAETLARLEAVVAATAPATVVCLGDSFDDMAAAEDLDTPARDRLARLAEGRAWVWVAGNHDPRPPGLPGIAAPDWTAAPLRFRHEPGPPAEGWAEVAAHLHPKARLGGRSRPCFVIGAGRVILPAFGAYTGGMPCDHPDVAAMAGPGAIAVVTGTQALAMPLAPPTPIRRRGWRLP
jgi:hypothetical protein